ncbi:AMP-forming long-chain acyl-CoA synthetase [Cyanobium sp. Copco_Reservoir_LC18]|jgi:long-chain acyl-CoA synthetase|uniref:AMP-binding protein n=1 Tax=Cyanobium sp. Copco_Reservoir_LC18 TaxID=1328305 RepID=UPI001358BE1E|nr:AMP-binding protein [Cyanobium sp. Copco_Reservoir_LC18]KAF0654987.1 AMP-forming long-chain acyl-CoA synthetase [Cyanobium sp. Copco_Reservoir_LC18]
MNARAEIHWGGSAQDRRALAARRDWSQLQGLEGLWPELERSYGPQVALEAPHGRHPETLRYGELRQAIDRTAAAFADLGVGPGDVVALFAENGPRWLVADQGLMRAGAADAVRGSAAPAEELRYILEDAGAVGAVLESAALLERLALDGPALRRLRFIVLLEGEAPSMPLPLPCLTWDELLQRGAASPLPPVPTGGPGRLATLLYTSGTTGQPKGVPLSHANVLHQLATLGVAVSPSPGDHVLSVLPIWHAYERTAEYFLLSCGCRQTYTTLKQLRSDLQKVRPQYLISVPRLWEALLSGFEDALAAMPASRQRLLRRALAASRAFHRRRRTALDLTLKPVGAADRLVAAAGALLLWPLHGTASALLWPKVRAQLVGGRLRTAISGGGALAIHVDGFFEAVGIELLVGYGLTETSPVLACRRPWSNRRGSAGQPLPDTALKVVDPATRTPLPVGERGLVLARGPQVMGGYHNKPEATAKVLDGEGWFDTGDLGLLLADGTLVLTGRAKDTIVLSSGENIEPGPLEEALVASPLVEQVMLVGQDRKQLGALVVPKAEALQAFAAEAKLPCPGPEEAPAAADPALLRALCRECNRLLAARPGSRADERLGGVVLVEPFSIDNGLLTQTLKQRRDRIADRDRAAIAALYGESGSHG